jgi:hypothetical protein
MMHLDRDSAIQRSSRRFYTVSESDPIQSFERRDILPGCSTIQASSGQKMRTFRPNLPLCREASNCTSLHPSGRFSSTSGHHSMFNHLCDFFSKHRYGKEVATVRTMWIPIRTRSSIRQVVHSKARRLDTSLQGSDTEATYMEITCIRSTVQTTCSMVWTRKALIWKLCAAKV